MSAYQVAKFCRDCLRDPALRQEVLAHPEEATARYDLSSDERSALLAGEVGELFRLGCSPFLLSYLPRWGLFGVDVPSYSARMRAARD